MYVDKLLQFFDSTADVVINVGNAIAGDVIDTGSAPTLKDLGNGQPLYWVLVVTTSFADGAAETATVKFDLYSDSTANLATSATTHATTGALALTSLTAGSKFVIPLPVGATYERYVGLWETVGTANLSAGAAVSFITADPHGWVALPDAI